MGAPRLFVLACIACIGTAALGAERFPPPDFTSHQLPTPTAPHPRQTAFEYLDVAVLLAALSLASYFALRLRSRRAIFALTIFSLAYFGFYRQGCVCPIGSIQNVVLTIFDSSYAIPLAVLAFFALPLIFTLFFGRTFCSSVCPLGAIQDVFVLAPVKVPGWLERSLGLFPFVYLGLAVLFAATGSSFVICRYDPFVGFFRLTAGLNMFVLGVSLLVIGAFIGRPYCRFICPYGAILGLLSRLSRRRVTITPDRCIQCRLCEDACPFGAISEPAPEAPPRERSRGKAKLGALLALLPLLVAGGAALASNLTDVLSRDHPTVRLAEQVYLEEKGAVAETTKASDAFRTTGETVENLYARSFAVKDEFRRGNLLFGGFVGLVIGATLISLAVRRRRTDFEADRALCVACGRCYLACPIEHDRLKQVRKP